MVSTEVDSSKNRRDVVIMDEEDKPQDEKIDSCICCLNCSHLNSPYADFCKIMSCIVNGKTQTRTYKHFSLITRYCSTTPRIYPA